MDKAYEELVNKHVISVSLGSSLRNHEAEIVLGKYKLLVQRIGTDGDKKKLKELINFYDGKIDAIGLGGTDLYLYAGDEKYTFSESKEMVSNAKHTPVVDGSGIKNSLERQLIIKLNDEGIIDFKNKQVLLVCAVDRFGMAEALETTGCKLVLGDFLYGLNVNYPIKSTKTLKRFAKVLGPIITRLPIEWFYPIGKEQDKTVVQYPQYFQKSDVIAGDFHLIKRYMPDNMSGKIIITNTVTEADRKKLITAGVKMLITTTPQITGRSFGTNVLEAILVAIKGGTTQLESKEYEELLNEYKIEASIESF